MQVPSVFMSRSRWMPVCKVTSVLKPSLPCSTADGPSCKATLDERPHNPRSAMPSHGWEGSETVGLVDDATKIN